MAFLLARLDADFEALFSFLPELVPTSASSSASAHEILTLAADLSLTESRILLNSFHRKTGSSNICQYNLPHAR